MQLNQQFLDQMIQYINNNQLQQLQQFIGPHQNTSEFCQLLLWGFQNNYFNTDTLSLNMIIMLKNSIKKAKINSQFIIDSIQIVINLLSRNDLTFQKINCEILQELFRAQSYDTIYKIGQQIEQSQQFQNMNSLSKLFYFKAFFNVRRLSISKLDVVTLSIQNALPIISNYLYSQNGEQQLNFEQLLALQTLNFAIQPFIPSIIYQSHIINIVDTLEILYKTINAIQNSNQQLQQNIHIEITKIFNNILISQRKQQNSSELFQQENYYSPEIKEKISNKLFQFALDQIVCTCNEFVQIELFDIIYIVLEFVNIDDVQLLQQLYQHILQQAQLFINKIINQQELNMLQTKNMIEQQLQEALSSIYYVDVKIFHIDDKKYIKQLSRLLVVLLNKQIYPADSLLPMMYEQLIQLQEADTVEKQIQIVPHFYLSMCQYIDIFKSLRGNQSSVQYQKQFFEFCLSILSQKDNFVPIISWHTAQIVCELILYNSRDVYQYLIQVTKVSIQQMQSTRTITELTQYLQLIEQVLCQIKTISSMIDSDQNQFSELLQYLDCTMQFIFKIPIFLPCYSQATETLSIFCNLMSYENPDQVCQIYCQNIQFQQLNYENIQQLSDLLYLFCSVYSIGGMITQDCINVTITVIEQMLHKCCQVQHPDNWVEIKKVCQACICLLTNQFIIKYSFVNQCVNVFTSLLQIIEIYDDCFTANVEDSLIVITDYCNFYQQNDIFTLIMQQLIIIQNNPKYNQLKECLIVCLSLYRGNLLELIQYNLNQFAQLIFSLKIDLDLIENNYSLLFHSVIRIFFNLQVNLVNEDIFMSNPLLHSIQTEFFQMLILVSERLHYKDDLTKDFNFSVNNLLGFYETVMRQNQNITDEYKLLLQSKIQCLQLSDSIFRNFSLNNRQEIQNNMQQFYQIQNKVLVKFIESGFVETNNPDFIMSEQLMCSSSDNMVGQFLLSQSAL